ncbi:fungal-specific transcription factor domain-containing protein [Rhexocercosporidium sp. MPI-PUGE-AT-0058]|nr:fungal-specific transcription factor domain-containing protein [Rhexocercosporidium sp. MPI-PUGE-AT-0058]
MSDTRNGLYAVSPVNAGDMYQSRPETVQKSTREQLPPLSSLFASTPHQPRPPQSSYSDGHSPVFPAVSPGDPRQQATPIHADRPFDSSYFQRPPVARQYSYNSRPEVERLGIPPPPRPSQLGGVRPESPRYDSRYPTVESSRPYAPSSVNAWSPHSQSNRPEYFSRDTSSSFRPHPEFRQPAAINRPEIDSRAAYRDGHHSAPVTPTYPPTPASTVTGDPITTKDGLGPKIWTGTQFLPRFVRSAEVPGEGMCYFYDDGTHCKTVIDGEIVNAHWGVTKAGKPRKRLAIACITCREKKIKCDPDYPRCVQCEKFGRICKFKNAPRGGHGSPDTPPSDPEDSVSRPASSRADIESFKVEKRESSHSVSPRQVRQATPDSEIHHSKRQRTGYNDFTPVASEASPRPSFQDPTSPRTPWAEHVNNSLANQSSLTQEWQTNPFSTHPMLVGELITVFFKHIPETAYSMFPEGPFKAWVLSVSEKSADELMLVYTVLALGTVFSQKSEHRVFGAQFAAVSRFACDNSRFSIQLVQSRVLLALYYFANNKAEDAWDFCGAALRAASGIKLNLEIEKTDDAYRKSFPYGLTRAGFAECRRRTYWSCYLMDRFNGFCSGHLSIVQSDDVFLRLPCDVNSFESQLDIQNPFFDPTTPPIQNINWTIGSMAYLINITTIWGDVMANIYRTSHRPNPSNSRSNFPAFYDNATLRLRSWNDALPACYVFSAENLARAANGGKLGTFMMMHTVYHTTAMKLNRYIQQYNLTKSQLTHHVSVSKQHAEDLLKVVGTLATFKASAPSSPTLHGDSQTKFSSPFVGYAIVSAIDILTAKITVHAIANRLASFQGAQSILAELAQFWRSSQNQQALVQQRVRDLTELVRIRDEGPAAVGHIANIARETGDGVFEMREAIEKTFSRDYDCIYA